MLYRRYFFIFASMLWFCSAICFAQDRIELKTIQIKGNKELPKILYVVPWQDAQRNKDAKQKLKLHNFFGELYQPLTPAPPLTAFDER